MELHKHFLFLRTFLLEVEFQIYKLFADKPLPPTDLNVKEIFATHCTLNWKAPKDDGGAEITGE